MRTLAAAGPTLKISGWVSWILLVGSVCTAAVAIWKAAVPVIRAAVKFNETWPVLIQIGEDFRRNSGSSLRDRIERTDQNVAALGMVTIMENGKVVTKPTIEVLSELYGYSHDNNHLLKGRMDSADQWRAIIDKALAKVPEPVASSS